MKFEYLKFHLSEQSDFFGDAILKPVIPIGLTVGGEPFEYDALIDSGADFCIFDAGIGEALNLDISKGRKLNFRGIQESSAADAFIHEVTLLIGGWKYKTQVAFSYHLGKRSFGVLGQRGFFDLFVVKFDLLKEEIELTPKKK
ncbi:MAG: aspartyl protease family protein [Patescibacteria group bacterium]